MGCVQNKKSPGNANQQLASANINNNSVNQNSKINNANSNLNTNMNLNNQTQQSKVNQGLKRTDLIQSNHKSPSKISYPNSQIGSPDKANQENYAPNQATNSKISQNNNFNNPVSNSRLSNQNHSGQPQFPSKISQNPVNANQHQKSLEVQDVHISNISQKIPIENQFGQSRRSYNSNRNMEISLNNKSIEAVRQEGDINFDLGVSKFDIHVPVMQ